MRRIYWDTMIHAYWFEDRGILSKRVYEIHQAMAVREDVLCSSLFVLSELLVRPVKFKDAVAADLIANYFYSERVTLLPFLPKAVRIFAALRADHGIKALDALHLAIAATSDVDLFVTNDKRLHQLTMPGLPFIASMETEIFPYS